MKRGGVSNHIIQLIIVVLVIVSVVFLFPSIGFAKYFEFLPGFGQGDGDKDEKADYDYSMDNFKNFYDYSNIDENQLKNAILKTNFKSCSKYATIILKNSEGTSIKNPFFISVVIFQESACKEKAINQDSIGLMQVYAGKDGWCGKYGLSTNIEQCKTQLLEPEINIRVGSKILEQKYNEIMKWGENQKFAIGCGGKGCCMDESGNKKACDYKKEKGVIYYEFDGCENLNKYYTGWSAALRFYVGWGCNKGHDDYVEKVLEKYNDLISKIE